MIIGRGPQDGNVNTILQKLQVEVTKELKIRMGGKETLENQEVLDTVKSVAQKVFAGDSDKETHHADLTKLPQELLAFIPLKDMEEIQRISSKGLSEAEKQFQSNPKDETVRKRLRDLTSSLRVEYDKQILKKLATEGLFKQCSAVIHVGNEGFRKVYTSVWNNVIKASEFENIKQYPPLAKELKEQINKTGALAKQRTRDLLELYADAAAIKPPYDIVMQSIVRDTVPSPNCRGLDGEPRYLR